MTFAFRRGQCEPVTGYEIFISRGKLVEKIGMSSNTFLTTIETAQSIDPVTGGRERPLNYLPTEKAQVC